MGSVDLLVMMVVVGCGGRSWCHSERVPLVFIVEKESPKTCDIIDGEPPSPLCDVSRAARCQIASCAHLLCDT